MKTRNENGTLIRPQYRSETGKLTHCPHVAKNVFTYGSAVVTKFADGYCEAKIGNAMSWNANSEAALIKRLDDAGYKKS